MGVRKLFTLLKIRNAPAPRNQNSSAPTGTLPNTRTWPEAGFDPLEHYLLYGAGEGRDPGPEFSTAGYLERYPDVAEAGVNPLLHYLRYGKKRDAIQLPSHQPNTFEKLAEMYGSPICSTQIGISASIPRLPRKALIRLWTTSGQDIGRDEIPARNSIPVSIWLSIRMSPIQAKIPLVHYLLYGRDEGRLPKAGRALTLEQKLWGGFSRYALEELESLKCDPDAEGSGENFGCLVAAGLVLHPG